MLIKNYVAGDTACNYETYLTEIVNASSWFSSALPTSFCSPPSESHGECDAYSGEYGLDFKIIASKTAMQARSIYSFQIIRMTDGAYAFCESKEKGSMYTTRFPQALRGQTIEQLLAIRKSATKKQGSIIFGTISTRSIIFYRVLDKIIVERSTNPCHYDILSSSQYGEVQSWQSQSMWRI